MFNAKRSLPRRTVLRGLGTALALPFLESMVPSFSAFAQSAAVPPLRFGGIYLPNGMPIKDWMPTTTDGTLEITVLAGLTNVSMKGPALHVFDGDVDASAVIARPS